MPCCCCCCFADHMPDPILSECAASNALILPVAACGWPSMAHSLTPHLLCLLCLLCSAGVKQDTLERLRRIAQQAPNLPCFATVKPQWGLRRLLAEGFRPVQLCKRSGVRGGAWFRLAWYWWSVGR